MKLIDPADYHTLWELFESSSSTSPNVPAIQMWRDNALADIYTFQSLKDAALAHAEKLKKMGILPGDRIVIVGENSCEWVVVFLAIMARQATAVLIEPKLEGADYLSMIKKADPSLIIISKKCFKKLPDTSNVNIPILSLQLTSFSSDKEGFVLRNAQDGDPQVALLLFTSGTTGDFKGVMLEHAALLSVVSYPIQATGKGIGQQVLNVLPFTHIFGAVASFVISLGIGLTVTIVETVAGEPILRAMQITKTEVLPSVPRLIELFSSSILQKIKEEKPAKFELIKKIIRFSAYIREKSGINLGKLIFSKIHKNFGGNLKTFISAGAHLEPSIYETMFGLGFTIQECYGLTETCGPAFFSPYNETVKGSVGKCEKKGQVKILTEIEGDSGEIIYKGPSLMKEYFRDPVATAKVLSDGWFHTGDIGHLDNRGNLFITGRIKEVIITPTGEKAMPLDVERRYKDILGIHEIAVFGAPSAHTTGEEIHAAVVVAEELKLQHGKDEVLHQVISSKIFDRSKHVPVHLRIFHIHLIDEIPRTTTLKVKRMHLKNILYKSSGEKSVDQSENIQKESVEETLSQDQVTEKVIGLVKNTLKMTNRSYEGEVSESTTFLMDLGLDSLSVLELIFSVEKEFSIRLGNEPLDDIQTVKDLAHLIKQTCENKPIDGVKSTKPEIRRFHTLIQNREQVLDTSSLLSSIDGGTQVIFGKWFQTLFNQLYTLEVKNKEVLQQTSPFILIVNHSSHLDTIALLAATEMGVDKFAVLAAKDYFFKNDKSNTMMSKVINMLPFDRENSTKAIIDNLILCKKCLEMKKHLILYPEGTRSMDGKLQPFKSFMSLAAVELGLPIIPACIKGTFDLMPKGSSWPKFGKISVSFGEPLNVCDYLKTNEERIAVDVYQAVTEEVRSRVIKLQNET